MVLKYPLAMGIIDDITLDWHATLAALSWQVDLGVSDVIGEVPVDRYDLPEPVKAAAAVMPLAALPQAAQAGGAQAGAAQAGGAQVGPIAAAPLRDLAGAVAMARAMADAALTLEDLRAAVQGFDLCDIKRGAKSTVFGDGHPAARVMIVTEPPRRDEDIAGRPMVGAAGVLLDRMFAAIGLSRTNPDPAQAIYVTPVLPWFPPQNHDAGPGDIAMMRPFVERHVALVDPDIILCMGNTARQALLGTAEGARPRGVWAEALGRPVLTMADPAYLLRNPAAKREAWADLLALRARLR